jgi:ABC-type polysaccharide/polyol phosphate export permease
MLPLSVVFSTGINFLLSLPALLIFMVFLRPNFNPQMAYLPLLMVTQAIFLIGVGFFISALNVFFRDTSVLVEVGLSAWFFLTPIIYDAKDVAGDFVNWMYYLNPMASIIANYRDVFYYNDPASPDLMFMLRTLATCTILCVLGYLFFMRVSKHFGEEV